MRDDYVVPYNDVKDLADDLVTLGGYTLDDEGRYVSEDGGIKVFLDDMDHVTVYTRSYGTKVDIGDISIDNFGVCIVNGVTRLF